MIHLRAVVDGGGDAVDYQWYCGQWCYADSLVSCPVSDSVELGGAWPGGAEHDGPDFCATCGDAIGNPLTSEGVERVREWLLDVPFRPTGTLATRADALRKAYPVAVAS